MQGAGFAIWADGQKIAQAETLGVIEAKLPNTNSINNTVP
jgi:hypothetical protein